MIKSVTYGVVLLSIVMTSFLLLLLEKAGLSALYVWILTLDSQKLSGYCRGVTSLPKPNLSGCYARISSLPISEMPGRVKALSSVTKLRARNMFYDFGRPKKYPYELRDRTGKPKR